MITMCPNFFARLLSAGHHKGAQVKPLIESSIKQLDHCQLHAHGAHSHHELVLDECDETSKLIAFTRDEEITIRILEVSSSTDVVAISAAASLFAKAHISNIRHEEHKCQMGAEGAIPALGRLLSTSLELARYHACSALSELAFENPANCLAIVNTPRMLKNIVYLLQTASIETREDAGRVINNCAAFCEDCIPIIVKHPGMLAALTSMAQDGEVEARHIAVSALNSLSRSSLGRAEILRSNVLHALASVLEEGDDRQCATHASAAMAIASLTGATQPVDAHRSCPRHGHYLPAVHMIVDLLHHSIHRVPWANILFRPCSVLYPLHQLSCHPANRGFLLEYGILDHLRDCLSHWHTWARPRRCLDLVLRTLQNLSESRDCRQSMLDAGIFDALCACAAGAHCDRTETSAVAAVAAAQHPAADDDSSAAIADITPSSGPIAVPAILRRRAEEVVDRLSEGYVAVMMGHHRRLGAASPLMALDEATAALILQFVMQPAATTAAAASTATADAAAGRAPAGAGGDAGKR